MKKFTFITLLLITVVFSYGAVCEMNPPLEDAFKPTSKIGTGIYRQELCVSYAPGSKKPGKVLLQTFVVTTNGKDKFETHFDSQMTDVDCFCVVKKEQPPKVIIPQQLKRGEPEPDYRLRCVKC